MTNLKLTIISRASRLALWQARFVKQQLQLLYPKLDCDIISRTTEGDRNTGPALGKSLFVKELQEALLNREAHIAVHSLKDMSVTDHSDLLIAAICRREDARDVFISTHAENIMQLQPHAIIGTSSPRRQCQLKALRKDIVVKTLRGNVDTRLTKINHEYDAIVLAAAGIKRLGYENHIRYYFDPHIFIPAIGQGALAIECRRDDVATQHLLLSLDDGITRLCVTAERAVNRVLHGDCHTPIGAYAVIHGNNLQLNAMIGTPDGSRIIRAQATGNAIDAENIGTAAAEQLLNQGATEILSYADDK